MNKYKADTEVPGGLLLALDTTITVGSYVAVLDDDEDKYYHIGEVVDITDDITTIHYFGTKSKNIRSAVWTKLYHHPGSKQVVTHQPDNLVRNWMRFTGTISTLSPEDSLIILPNIGFTDTMRINATSRKALSALQQRHHIMGRTWHP